MPEVKITYSASGALRRRLKDISSAVDPRSGKMDYFRRKLSTAITEDNVNKLTHYGGGTYAGIDRFGQDLTAPAESTLKQRRTKYGGSLFGFVLAPRGVGSRVITNFFVRWSYSGSRWVAAIGWKGIPWLKYHLEGCPKGSNGGRPNWSLPRRDIAGITPKGWVIIRGIFQKFRESV